MAAEQDLGAVIERYETDHRRRRGIAVVGVPLGAVVTCLGVLMIALIGGPDEVGGSTVFPGLVCGFGLSVLGAGIWQGLLSVTRPGEVFTLHEGGLVHAYAGKSWAVGWDEMAKVSDRGNENVVHRALGWDFYYRIKLRSAVGGRRAVVITGLTEDAMWLGEAVRQAVEDGAHPKPPTT
jgi:hypothetical protein